MLLETDGTPSSTSGITALLPVKRDEGGSGPTQALLPGRGEGGGTTGALMLDSAALAPPLLLA
jgi:hypothetical protein